MYPINSQYLMSHTLDTHTSKMHRAEICRVGNGKCLEDTPWETLDDTAHEEHLQAGREEWNKDSANHEDQATNHCLLVSYPFCDISVDDEADDASDLWRYVSHAR